MNKAYTIVAMLMIVMIPSFSHAFYFTAFEASIGTPLCKVMWAFEGTVGRMIAAFAIMAGGLYALFTRQRWPFVASLVVGVVVLSFASMITDKLAGSLLPLADPTDVLNALDANTPTFNAGRDDISCALAWTSNFNQKHIKDPDGIINKMRDTFSNLEVGAPDMSMIP